jgi:hypothetical protein
MFLATVTGEEKKAEKSKHKQWHESLTAFDKGLL